MQQYNGAGKICTPNNPWLVDSIFQAFDTEDQSVSLNLVNNVKDAAGSTVVLELPGRRIMDQEGTKLGSYWGSEENLQYTTPVNTPNGDLANGVLSGVVLTDGSAALAIYDANVDLEKIFESNTKARYIMKLTDMTGKAYYGYIGGVSVSSNVYTFSIYSEVGLSNQNWVKTWGSGIAAPYMKAEIYENSTSFELASTDTFNQEVPYSPFATDYNQLKGLSNGQFCIDYRRGRFLGRKLNADDTEIVTYKSITSPNSSGVPTSWSIVDGRKVVTAATTAEALSATSAQFKTLTVQAEESNTGDIMIGASTVVEAPGTDRGLRLIPGGSYHIAVPGDLADVYIDAEVSGDGVTFLYTT